MEKVHIFLKSVRVKLNGSTGLGGPTLTDPFLYGSENPDPWPTRICGGLGSGSGHWVGPHFASSNIAWLRAFTSPFPVE